MFAYLIFYRDLVHRQTACAAIKHMALGVSGFGCEDALTHLINYVWPNIFETSPHVVNAVMESIEGMRVALGPSKVLHYCLQVRSYAIFFLFVLQFVLVTSPTHFIRLVGTICRHVFDPLDSFPHDYSSNFRHFDVQVVTS